MTNAAKNIDAQILYTVETCGRIPHSRSMWINVNESVVLTKLSNWASPSTLRRRIKSLADSGKLVRSRSLGGGRRSYELRTTRSIRSERMTQR